MLVDRENEYKIKLVSLKFKLKYIYSHYISFKKKSENMYK